MALYPSLTDVPYNTINGTSIQKILKTSFEDLGKEQRKRKWLYKKRNYSLQYRNITDNQLQILLEFEKARHGEYSSFTFILPDILSDSYSDEYVGTGDGSEKVFNMPCISSGRTVYVDGNAQSEAADATAAGDFYIDEEGGQDGVDSLIFAVAPLEGKRITCDFDGQLAIRCRFEGGITYDRIHHIIGLNNVVVTLNGLLIDE